MKLGDERKLLCVFFFCLCFLGGLKVTCEYLAQQEGVLCEEVLLLSETNDDVCVRVKVHARVMGEVTFRVTSNKRLHCVKLFFLQKNRNQWRFIVELGNKVTLKVVQAHLCDSVAEL